MARGKPFSGKAKKAQLQEKREKKADKQQKYEAYLKRCEGGSADCVDTGATAASNAAASLSEKAELFSIQETHGEGASGRKAGQAIKNSKRSLFRKESKLEVAGRRQTAQVTYSVRRCSQAVAFTDWWDWEHQQQLLLHNPHPDDDTPLLPTPPPQWIALPERPAFVYKHEVEEGESDDEDSEADHAIAKNERRYFKKYLRQLDVLEQRGATLNLFERNLEVWRELWRVADGSNVIAIIADARNPLYHIPPSLVHYVSTVMRKPAFIVLNKVDLIPEATLNQWTVLLKEWYPSLEVLLFTCQPDKRSIFLKETGDKGELFWRKKKTRQTKTSLKILNQELSEEDNETDTDSTTDLEAFKGEEKYDKKEREERREDERTLRDAKQRICDMVTAIKETAVRLHNTEASSKVKRQVVLGMIGSPNVGKSSVINALRGEKLVSTSATAGHTKRLQHIPIDDNLMLCDCPGLIFPVQNLPVYMQTLLGTFSLAQNREPYSIVHFLGYQLPLEKIYHINKPRGAEDEGWSGFSFCEAYAEKSGFFVKRGRGIPDTYRGGQVLLKEAVTGVLSLYFMPPEGEEREKFVMPSVIDPGLDNDVASVSSASSLYSNDEGICLLNTDDEAEGEDDDVHSTAESETSESSAPDPHQIRHEEQRLAAKQIKRNKRRGKKGQDDEDGTTTTSVGKPKKGAKILESMLESHSDEEEKYRTSKSDKKKGKKCAKQQQQERQRLFDLQERQERQEQERAMLHAKNAAFHGAPKGDPSSCEEGAATPLTPRGTPGTPRQRSKKRVTFAPDVTDSGKTGSLTSVAPHRLYASIDEEDEEDVSVDLYKKGKKGGKKRGGGGGGKSGGHDSDEPDEHQLRHEAQRQAAKQAKRNKRKGRNAAQDD